MKGIKDERKVLCKKSGFNGGEASCVNHNTACRTIAYQVNDVLP